MDVVAALDGNVPTLAGAAAGDGSAMRSHRFESCLIRTRVCCGPSVGAQKRPQRGGEV